MRDAIFFGKTSGVNQSLRRFLCLTQREAEIDARLCRRLNLRKDMIAIKWNDRLTRTCLHVFARLQSEFQKRIIDWSQMLLLSGEHFFNVILSGLQISITVAELVAFSN